MAERCYIHGPTTTAGTCPTCDAMQREDNEITRLRARLAEAEAVIKPFAEAAVRPVPLNLLPVSYDDWRAAAEWMKKENKP